MEKRSQALQACNLTRNIQADGAPMVHRTPEASAFRVLFFFHRAPESCLPKRFREPLKASPSPTVPSQCQRGRFVFGSSGDLMSPTHLSGTLQREVHEDHG